MELLQSGGKVLAHAIFVAFVSVNGEERYVLQVGSNLRVAPDTEMCLVERAFSLEYNRILLPVFASNVQSGIAYFLVVTHGGIFHQVDPKFGGTSIRHARPYREAVFLVGFDADAEEAFVFNHGMLVAMARRSEAYIVWIPVKRTVVAKRNLSGDGPSRIVVRKLERPVFQ